MLNFFFLNASLRTLPNCSAVTPQLKNIYSGRDRYSFYYTESTGTLIHIAIANFMKVKSEDMKIVPFTPTPF
jgi:hypothetical protein